MLRLLVPALAVLSASACLQFNSDGRYQCDPANHADCDVDAGPGGGGGHGDGGADAGMDAGGIVVDPSLVLVHRVSRFFLFDGGVTTVALGVTGAAPFNAPQQYWKVDATTGSLEPVTPVDLGNGSFTLDIPPGTEWAWGGGTARHFTSAREVDMGSDEQGRPGVAPRDGGTSVQLTGTGMQPIAANDDFEASSPQAAESGQLDPVDALPQGSTSLTGAAFNYFSYVGFSTSAQAGDQVFVSHRQSYVPPDAPAMSCSTIVDVLTSSSTDLGVGQPVIQGSFKPVQPQLKAVQLDGARFAQLAPRVAPGAYVRAFHVSVNPVTAPLEYGWVGYLGSELDCTNFLNANDTLPAAVSLHYGTQPYRRGGFAEVLLTYRYALTPSADGLTFPGNATWWVIAPEEELFSGLIQPELTPPTDAAVDGTLFTTQGPTQLKTAAPMVSWAAPTDSLRPPTEYFVTVYELTQSAGGGWTSKPAFTLRTTKTQVRIPPGVLGSGKVYTLILGAEAMEGGKFDVTTAPIRNYRRQWRTTIASGTFVAP